MKRLFDLFFSAVLLVLLIPVFILIAILIAFDSGLPVFFVQKRMGRYGIPFYIYKFRTMCPLKGTSSGSFHAGDRSRVTAVGRILRKTKLDELPQLWNVLKGNMSFVGPRPEVPQWVEVYPQRWDKVLCVRPGITDNASILFRGEEAVLAISENPEEYYRQVILPRKLEMYEQYVNHNSLIGDLNIMLKTFWTVLVVNREPA